MLQRSCRKGRKLGGSVLTIFSPIPEVQFSVEVEQLNVHATQNNATAALNSNGTYDSNLTGKNFDVTRNFWTTALFVGGGYNVGNVTVGGRYNLLFDTNKSAYSSAVMPFVRVFF